MDGRIALVTGANRGIGLEVVRQLARRGFVAILGARGADRGEAAARGLRREGLEVEVRLDVADDASVDALRLASRENGGRGHNGTRARAASDAQGSRTLARARG
jgi:NAD(P)-dependent dehydrogenase (short-subunit alcohol dehydrogenase family)